jgi:hypothetical protein
MWYVVWTVRFTQQAPARNFVTAGLQVREFPALTGSYTADGVSGFAYSCVQTEVGAFPTSYIPTVASQVTRAADSVTLTEANFTNFYLAAEGTFVVDWTTFDNSTARIFCVQSAGSITTDSILLTQGSAGTSTAAQAYSSSVLQVNYLAVPTGGSGKVALAYALNNFASSSSGATVLTDTSAVLPVGLDRLFVGLDSAGNQLNGYIRRIAYYPDRLTNADLQALSA